MRRILAFTSGPQDWQALLAAPVKHWRRGYSARTLACSWEAADGFPPQVAKVLCGAADPLLKDIEPILAILSSRCPFRAGVFPNPLRLSSWGLFSSCFLGSGNMFAPHRVLLSWTNSWEDLDRWQKN